MEGPLKRKVTAKVDYHNIDTSMRPSSRNAPRSRPTSPFKPHSPAPGTSLSPPLSNGNVVRPRAKVNSSATVRKVSSTLSTTSSSSRTAPSSASTISRAPSPYKSPTTRTGNGANSPPTVSVKARVTVRPPSSPALSTPDSRQRSLTTVATDASKMSPGRPRPGSFSLQRQASVASLHGYSASSSAIPSEQTTLGAEDWNGSTTSSSHLSAQPIRIKSKVSGLARNTPESSPHPGPRSAQPRSRAPSISGHTFTLNSAPSSPDTQANPGQAQTFYPITTAVSAANPYRFATTRPTPSPNNHHHYQPFASAHDDQAIQYGRPASATRVDPATIPLPPVSPPTSAVSFSSRSSISRSSASAHTESSADSRSMHTLASVHMNNGLQGLRHRRSTSLKNSVNHIAALAADSDDDDSADGDGNSNDDDVGEERKVKAAAKSNRKIADLEITNRSLLAINQSLESTKHRQAKEIRDLRRKLRESRLILPPRAYRAVKSSLDHDDTAEDDDEDDEDEEQDGSDAQEGTEDAMYKRVKLLLDGLITGGQRALESKPEDFLGTAKGGTKVLHADEVRNWRRDSGGDVTLEDIDPSQLPDNDDTVGLGIADLHPNFVRVSGSDEDSDDEPDAASVRRDSASSVPPPITITPS